MKIIEKVVLCDVCPDLERKAGYSILFEGGSFNLCNKCKEELYCLISPSVTLKKFPPIRAREY